MLAGAPRSEGLGSGNPVSKAPLLQSPGQFRSRSGPLLCEMRMSPGGQNTVVRKTVILKTFNHLCTEEWSFPQPHIHTWRCGGFSD